jgi:hypothetical protein
MALQGKRVAGEDAGLRARAKGDRVYCPKLAGREMGVYDGLVRFSAKGFALGLVERPRGTLIDPPAPLPEEFIRGLEEACGAVVLSPHEARVAPLTRENERRREAFESRVRSVVEAARSRYGRWPSIREVQAVLAQLRLPRGRKEKIGGLLARMKQEHANRTTGGGRACR